MIKRILLILCLTILLTSFTGCGLFNHNYIISKYPDRLIYIIGYDTELDLTGGETEDIMVYKGEETIKTYLMESCRVVHKIDFNKPGSYMVKVYNSSGNEVTFAIQVVDAEYIDNIIENIINSEIDRKADDNT